MAKKITAVILTKNESQHIRRCIDSLAGFVSDVVVVDSFSDDDTVEIAKSCGARVFQNPWKNYSTQFQWGLDHGEITTEWVMRIDADEYLETPAPKVLDQLEQLPDDVAGAYVKRKYFFLGKWIRHGAMYPIFVLRLWKNGAGRIENRWMDEHIVLDEGRSISIDADIVDDNMNSVSWWIDKHNWYASREVLDILNGEYKFLPLDEALNRSQDDPQAKRKRLLKENVYNKLPIFVRPVIYFFYRYFLRLGFLDGVRGFAFHFLQGLWYRVLIDTKVLEAKKWIGSERDPESIRTLLAEKTGLNV